MQSSCPIAICGKQLIEARLPAHSVEFQFIYRSFLKTSVFVISELTIAWQIAWHHVANQYFVPAASRELFCLVAHSMALLRFAQTDISISGGAIPFSTTNRFSCSQQQHNLRPLLWPARYALVHLAVPRIDSNCVLTSHSNHKSLASGRQTAEWHNIGQTFDTVRCAAS